LAQNFYECMFIFDPNLYARDPNGVSGKVVKMVEKSGGEILVSRLWNEQRLAYPIKGHRKGTYWLSYFKMDSSRLVEFRRACQLNEDILRNLIVKIDARLIDAVVEHAKGTKVVPPPVGVPIGTAPEEEVEEVEVEAGVEGEAAAKD
jgi:small subunit ribosomal protein S6